MSGTSRLIESLADVCQRRMLEEKWLLVPSLRVGHQWLDWLARSGAPSINLHLKTVAGLAAQLAGLDLEAGRQQLLPATAAPLLVERAYRHLQRQRRLRYLDSVAPSAGLCTVLARSIHALRMAGADPEQWTGGSFESPDKEHDLRMLLGQYLAELSAVDAIDEGGVLGQAIQRLQQSPAEWPDVLLLQSEDLRLVGREASLLDLLPAERRILLEADEEDAALAAEPSFFRAAGEVNEVRHVLRDILARGTPLDEVELLHTDTAVYVPLIYETMACLQADQDGVDQELPVTFAEGLPTRYFRPGRLLSTWVAWVREECSQLRLVHMLREGLLDLRSADGSIHYSRLASELQRIGIGFGCERYLPQLDEAIAAADRRIQNIRDDEEQPLEGSLQRAQRRQRDLRQLKELVASLLQVAPATDADADEVLQAAQALLERHARVVNKADAFARQRLLEEIEQVRTWKSDGVAGSASEIWDWLSNLPTSVHVLGSGPQPGCLHVASVASGGHSGRRHTYLVGLDEGRLPGDGSPDPFLLDSERRKISPHLPTSGEHLQRKTTDFRRLLSRLRGVATFSYSCRDLTDGRGQFPSTLLLGLWRRSAAQPDASQDDFLEAVQRPVSFAPRPGGACLDSRDWWLQQFCTGALPENALQVLEVHHTHLAQGRRAEEARASQHFTPYDGYVPQAGVDLDPTAANGPVLSASRLETLGTCPLRYFFQHVLRIEPLDSLELDPSVWLDPLAQGALLHEVFERFLRELAAEDAAPSLARHEHRLQQILEECAASYREAIPPPTPYAYESQMDDFSQIARTFLVEEETLFRHPPRKARYLEASLGMPPSGAGTELDWEQPVPLQLPDGSTVLLRGRVDRIDEVVVNDVRAHFICDYKTGSAYKYRDAAPFAGGQVIQHAVYIEMVNWRLRQLGKPPVSEFGYFFPGRRERGKRLQWTASELADGPQVLLNLVDVIRKGVYLATGEVNHCTYCDYAEVCSDPAHTTECSRRKQAESGNAVLHILGVLKQYE